MRGERARQGWAKGCASPSGCVASRAEERKKRKDKWVADAATSGTARLRYTEHNQLFEGGGRGKDGEVGR